MSIIRASKNNNTYFDTIIPKDKMCYICKCRTTGKLKKDNNIICKSCLENINKVKIK